MTWGKGAARADATAADIAWLMAVPCAAITLAAIVLLGPWLGGLLPDAAATPWPSAGASFRPEPTEQGRYLAALLGPLLLTAAVVRWGRTRSSAWASAARWVPAVQALGVVVVAICVVAQHRARFGPAYTAIVGTSSRTVYFTLATLVVATVVAALLAACLRSERVRRAAGAAARETRWKGAAAWVIAVAVTCVAVLPAINFEDTIMAAAPNVSYHVAFSIDEIYAVLDSRSPLVDFATQYAALWPYPLAAGMALAGETVGTFTLLTSTVTVLAMLALFATLRRVVASALAALLLFLPLMATSFYMMNGTLEHRYSVVTLTSVFPFRLAGPCFLLWLTARHLDGAWPRRRPLLFVVAGLVLLNNAEWGIPALGATVAALLWTTKLSVRAVGRMAVELLAGLLIAFALVALLTLARAGELPDVGLLFRYVRLFASSGFGLLPITPVIGVSTVVYLTFAAAIGTATVRAVERDRDRVMVGLLAWSGVFGMGVGSYYVGRSHPEVLINLFPAWALALTLLFVVAFRRAAERPSRWPSIAQLATFAGFGVLVCSLAQLPAPWTQLDRLSTSVPESLARPEIEAFVAARARPGERVALLFGLGHRVAVRVDVESVTPYTGEASMPTLDQFEETLRMLRREGGRSVFVSEPSAWPEVPQALEAAGLRRAAADPAAGVAQYVWP